MLLKFSGWVTEPIWNKVHGVCTPGVGVGKGENPTFRLTSRGFLRGFSKLTLVPASSVSSSIFVDWLT